MFDIFSEHPQKHPDVKALERLMAAGSTDYEGHQLETITEEEHESNNGSKTTLISAASCKSEPAKGKME